MAAVCFWCSNQQWFQAKVKGLGAIGDPVGECDSCSVHTCNDHGVRGRNALFVCLVCIPNQVRHYGSGVLQVFPDLERRLRNLEVNVELLRSNMPEAAARRIEAELVAPQYLSSETGQASPG